MKVRKNFSKIGGIYFIGSLLIILTQMIAMQILWVTSPNLASDSNVVLIISSISGYVISVPFMAWLMKYVKTPSLYKEKENAELESDQTASPNESTYDTEIESEQPVLTSVAPAQKHMNFGRWFLAFLMSYSLVYVSNFIGLFLTNIIASYKGAPVQNPLAGIVSEISPWTALLAMVIMAPIAEEFLFRKILIDRVKCYGEGAAVFLSGLMFGAMHGNLNQFDYAFSLGLFFGFIYVKTGKLRYTIFLHAAVNFFGSIPGMLLTRSEAFEKLSSFTGNIPELGALLAEHGQTIVLIYVYLILTGLMVIAGLVCWILSFRKMHCQPGILKEMGLKAGGKVNVMILNVGMLAYLVFWIIQMVKQAMI